MSDAGKFVKAAIGTTLILVPEPATTGAGIAMVGSAIADWINEL